MQALRGGNLKVWVQTAAAKIAARRYFVIDDYWDSLISYSCETDDLNIRTYLVTNIRTFLVINSSVVLACTSFYLLA
jgi:hypothetical protein